MTDGKPADANSADVEAKRKTKCPDHVLRAIYGDIPNKAQQYDKSLHRWWEEYSDRKNDEEDEHVADSLLYDRNHLPRTAPPPECVHEFRQQAKEQAEKDAALLAPTASTE